MSAFYIGQRLRKVRGVWNIGMECVVVAFDPNDPEGMTLGVVFDQRCVGEMCGILTAVAPGEVGYGYPGDFEPVNPPGLESPERITELFQPSPEVMHA